jgi:SAM-dependent methyltransferase
MRRSVFPKKLDASIQKHYEILARELASAHGEQVLEVAAGSGSAVHFLSNDNHYTGTDISAGLLKRAASRFQKAGFREPSFYVASADDLPFENGGFDLCLCILALNFFEDAEKVFQEIGRALTPGGRLVCCVPVPERNSGQRKIGGVLRPESTLEALCRKNDLAFERIPEENGALLYFRAIKQGDSFPAAEAIHRPQA